MAKRRIFSPDFKARVALAAMCGDVTIAELADRYLKHPKVTGKWKRWAPVRLKSTYERGGSPMGCNRVGAYCGGKTPTAGGDAGSWSSKVRPPALISTCRPRLNASL